MDALASQPSSRTYLHSAFASSRHLCRFMHSNHRGQDQRFARSPALDAPTAQSRKNSAGSARSG